MNSTQHYTADELFKDTVKAAVRQRSIESVASQINQNRIGRYNHQSNPKLNLQELEEF